MNTVLLAIDVGGSTSRASLVDRSGRCLGQGRSRGGNPASNTPELAAESIIAAVAAALADARLGEVDIALALIALAGPRVHVAEARLEAAFRGFGLSGPLVFAGDLEALLASVSAAEDGYCIVCGTGAGAVRIRNGKIERVADAAGWLLGDLGSGFWLGHQAVRAVTAALEGRGEATMLTPAVLEALAIEVPEGKQTTPRPLALQKLIDAVYALRPIELARLAPVVIAQRHDPVAARLLAEAERYLLDDFSMIYDRDMPGPVALGGGIVGHLSGLSDAVAEVIRAAGHSPNIRLVVDGSVGAMVMALRAYGEMVDEARLQAIVDSVAKRRARD